MTQSVGPKRVRAMQRHRRSVDAEAEQAAALLIDVLRTNGDVWRPTSFLEVTEYLKTHAPDWMENPFIRPNISDLAKRGYVSLDNNRIVFTESAMRKLNERAKKPTPASVKCGQWLLDTLDGRCSWNSRAPAQPSECQGLAAGEYYEPSPFAVVNASRAHGVPCLDGWLDPRVIYAAARRCTACNGSGHNTRGRLPRVELDSPQLRRRYFDSGEGEDGRSWLRIVPSLDSGAGQMVTVNGPTKQTRVVPRGEHLDATEPAT
jgi:hypothetical protein